jgi:flagellar biosynthetic protein FliQ
MTDHTLIELVRHALVAGLVVIAPVLIVGLATGVVTGVIQAASGVHEPIVGFVPKFAAMAVTFLLSLPWMVERLAQLFRDAAAGP